MSERSSYKPKGPKRCVLGSKPSQEGFVPDPKGDLCLHFVSETRPEE